MARTNALRGLKERVLRAPDDRRASAQPAAQS
jgi:hypothetical protein